MKTEIECKKVVIEKDDERRFKTIRIDMADGTYQIIEISFARLKGEWVYDDERPICPYCRTTAHFDDYYGFKLSNYCPECGADLT